MEHKLYELHAQMCRIFTSPKRLEILNLLRERELAVGELSEMADIPQSNISQHLSILREKGIVKTRRDGTTIYYSLVDPKIGKAFDIIREMLLEKLAKMEKFSKDLREKK